MPAIPEWSEESHLKLMEDLNISKSILSISTPGTHLIPGDSQLAAKVTRECNSYAADLKKRHPDKFGFWASLPLPDVDLCLKEMETAANEDCDGYCLLTNGHGHYLGDPSLDPVFEELNRRKATIFIHPTTPCIKCDPELAARNNASTDPAKPTKAAPFAGKYPNPMLEFFFDTARIVTNLFMGGTFKRTPNVTYIIPHVGGGMPPILSRFTGFSTLVPGPWENVKEEDALEAFKTQCYFDLAGFPFPGQIVGLVKGVGVPHSRLLYGSDYPFTKSDGVQYLSDIMETGVKKMFSEQEIEDIFHKNAERMLVPKK